MRVKVEGVEYIDAKAIAEMWGLASPESFFSTIHRAKAKHPENPFPEHDLVIDQKFFWSKDLIPQIMAWRRWQLRGAQ